MAGLTTLFSDGLLVAGDAAGFSLNMGITVRGMEFAIASGVIAARAVQQARERNDFSAASLACYQQMLEQSFVLQDFKTFRHAPHFLENPRLFSFYPQFAGRVMEEVFTFGEGPKAKLSDTVRKHLSFGEAWVARTSGRVEDMSGRPA